jgi:hypothetical protein
MEPDKNQNPDEDNNDDLDSQSFDPYFPNELPDLNSGNFDIHEYNEVAPAEDTSRSFPNLDRETIVENLIVDLDTDFPGLQKDLIPAKLMNLCSFIRESIRLKYHMIELRQSSFDNPTILRKTYIEEFEPLNLDYPLDFRAAEVNVVESNYLVNYKKLLHSILTNADGYFDNESLIESAAHVVQKLEHKFLIDAQTLKPLTIREAAERPLSPKQKDELIEFLVELRDEPWSMQEYDEATELAENELDEIIGIVKGGLDALAEADRQVNPIKLTEEIFKKAQLFGELDARATQLEALATYTNELGLDLPVQKSSGESFLARYSAIARITYQLIADSHKLRTRNITLGISTKDVDTNIACREWMMTCLNHNSDWLEQFLSN